MAVIGEATDYDAVAKVIRRRGLVTVYEEVLGILREVPIEVQKKRKANGAAYIREQIDAGFAQARGWRKTQVGGVDWIKEVELRSGEDVAIAALGGGGPDFGAKRNDLPRCVASARELE